MRRGEQIQVGVVKMLGDRSARVINVATSAAGILLIKGKLRVNEDGIVSTWVIDPGDKGQNFRCGNSYFGKYSILPKQADLYSTIIKSIYDNPNSLRDEDFSTLKGMCNRVIKKDQWDWFTTYSYLGFPSAHLLRSFVKGSLEQRNLLRNGQYNSISYFREKYHHMLSSMLFHLNNQLDVDDQDALVPIPSFDGTLWTQMSLESQKNLKFLERSHTGSSKYALIQYFVSFEQEFDDHYIQPFLDNTEYDHSKMECRKDQYKLTHDILTGQRNMTLGSIPFLGKLIRSRRALAASDAIAGFARFLGSKESQFEELCVITNDATVCGISIIQLRNSLSHGNSDILLQLDESAFPSLRQVLIEPPDELFVRLLRNSMRQ